jgi:predicted metal-dependent phosphoesterase TrpH
VGDGALVIKTELHAHTAHDPVDYIRHTTRELIDRAALLGYGALGITLHNRYYDPAEDVEYASQRKIVLISGIERTIYGRHVLLLNYPAECAAVSSFEDLRVLRERHPKGLVIAPHAFYPTTTAMQSLVERYDDLIDALEVNSMFMSWLDFNGRAIRWAAAHKKPLVGNSDLHVLDQLGTTYSLVDAPPDADAICQAIRAGRVQVRSSPLSTLRAGWTLGRMFAGGAFGRIRAALRR